MKQQRDFLRQGGGGSGTLEGGEDHLGGGSAALEGGELEAAARLWRAGRRWQRGSGGRGGRLWSLSAEGPARDAFAGPFE